MAMCKKCGEVVGVNDIVNGICKKCQPDTKVEEHKIHTEPSLDEKKSSHDVIKISIIFIIVLLVFVAQSGESFSTYSLGYAFLPSILISVVGFYIIKGIIIFTKEVSK